MIFVSFTIFGIYLNVNADVEICKGLTELGYDVYLIALRSKNRVRIRDSNVNLVLIPLRYMPIFTSIFFGIAVTLFLPFLMIAKKPKYIIMQPGTNMFSIVWKPLLSIMRTKLIFDIRSTPVEVISFTGALDAIMFDISVALSKIAFDGMTTITTLMRREICNKFHINPESVGVWTSGVSLKLFKPEDYNGLEMRKKYNLTEKFVVFYHGGISFTRGIIEVVKSIELCKGEYGDVIFFLVGKGQALQSIKEMIGIKGLEDRVIAIGAVDYMEVPKYISLCDVGIIPLPDLSYWRHQSPLKLLEYLAMKKPVIVTDIPAHRQVIGDSKCGIYISSADPQDIAKGISYAHDNIETLRKFGSFGRAIAEKYEWKEVAKDLETYLISIKS